MSSDALTPLMFTVGLVDKITSPAQKATKSFDDLVSTAKTGFHDMASGAIGLAGTGALIYQSLSPAIEMNRALGEVKSLGVQEDALNQLNISALEFSASYGSAADEFVRASYDIQSAIGGLSGQELSNFTTASGILAKGTKSDVATITNYMGTMYGVFKNTADQMGKSNWVEMVAGQTAAAVRMFKTTGSEMASGFGALGASATAMGVNMSEQLAVLGTLQATMSGSEAATKYNAFLSGAVSAQDSLGVSFFDATGNMKSMTDILDLLEGKIGHLDKAAKFTTLKDAFGTDEAVKLIQLLMAGTEDLAGSITELSEIKNMDQAAEMAEAMTDPWAQLATGIDAVRIAIGQALLPVINPLIDTMAAGAREVLYWTKLFPNLTKIVGFTAITILALGAGMAALTIAAGVGKAAWAGFMMIMKLGRLVTMTMAAAQWAMNAAFLASPVGLIVIGITGLVAVLYAAWMGIKALWNVFSDTAAGEAFTAMVQGIVDWFKSLGGIVDWVIEKLDKIPGISIGSEIEAPAPVNLPPEAETYRPTGIPGMQPVVDVESLNIDVPYRRETMPNEVPAGGVTNQISKSISDNSNKTTEVSITTNQPMSPALLNEFLLMEGA
ncbi:phage tail tape measure protein [Bacterioplanoides sp.]|uniref:phage tail tape measure protein n=1 Tax=Bacterioplanoides sp. TaxID=2066072 RepID=UPI003B5AD96D